MVKAAKVTAYIAWIKFLNWIVAAVIRVLCGVFDPLSHKNTGEELKEEGFFSGVHSWRYESYPGFERQYYEAGRG